MSATMESGFKYHGHDPIAPPSPALTNPDMILPFTPELRDSAPVPTDLLPLIIPRDREANKEAMPSGDTTPKGTLVGDLHSNTRPSLPGAWFTEEDIKRATLDADDHARSLVQPKTTVAAEQDFEEENNEYNEYGLGPYAIDLDRRTAEEEGGLYVKSIEDLRKTNEDSDSTMSFGRSNLARAVLEEDEDDPTSHAALSLRAEEILANAKKRLTDMEDNLARARRSLSATPSTSRSSPMTRFSRLSPYEKTSLKVDSWHLASVKRRQLEYNASPGSSGRHARVFSETSVPSRMPTLFPGKSQDNQRPRASSTMNSAESVCIKQAGVVRETSDNTIGGSVSPIDRSNGLVDRSNRQLEPLHEDESDAALNDTISPLDGPPLANDTRLYRRLTTSGSGGPYTAPRSSGRELTRARSNIQLRDLREQMHDLKEKVTSLQQRTRRDSLRRRSLQTLKTPSPFTVAPDWANNEDYFGNSPNSTSTGSDGLAHGKLGRGFSPLATASNPRSGEQLVKVNEDDEDGVAHHDADVNKDLNDNAHRDAFHIEQTDPEQDGGKFQSEEEQFVEAEENDGEPVYGIKEERHEDRADAFDFQHVFLYSGNNTSRQIDSRRNSQSSRGSVETTRPDTSHADESQDSTRDEHEVQQSAQNAQNAHQYNHFGHSRQNSKDSISTAATFATAMESRGGAHQSDGNGDWSYNPASQVWTNGIRPGSRHSANGQATRSKEQQVRNGTYLRAPNSPQARPGTAGSHTSRSPKETEEPTLFSTLLESIASPGPGTASRAPFSKTDDELIQRLLGSMQNACRNLSQEHSKGTYESRIWRRRLDMAKRVLDGDLEEDSI